MSWDVAFMILVILILEGGMSTVQLVQLKHFNYTGINVSK